MCCRWLPAMPAQHDGLDARTLRSRFLLHRIRGGNLPEKTTFFSSLQFAGLRFRTGTEAAQCENPLPNCPSFMLWPWILRLNVPPGQSFNTVLSPRSWWLRIAASGCFRLKTLCQTPKPSRVLAWSLKKCIKDLAQYGRVSYHLPASILLRRPRPSAAQVMAGCIGAAVPEKLCSLLAP